MSQRIGIDVGGTFTDAILIRKNRIQRHAKVPTQTEDILATILNALDALSIRDENAIDHITVSTTLITNAILQNRLPHVELFLFPGRGMALDALPWPVPYHTLTGEMDYRGREIHPPNKAEWKNLHALVQQNPSALYAIVGKFSHRNPLHEVTLANELRQRYSALRLAMGHEWGQANFYRRSLTTYLNFAGFDMYHSFAQHLQQAITARKIQAPISILKADGGVLPLTKIRPIDSIYSGPAASVLAPLTDMAPGMSAIVVDIGGTTTDIGLILSGVPLLSAKGAKIGPYSTLVRSLAVRSLLLGGDSATFASDEGFELKNYRLGPAYCLGGQVSTPTDAMRYLGLIDYGSAQRAEEALVRLLPPEERTPSSLRKLAYAIVESLVDQIAESITSLKNEWLEEPAYKVWEVLHPHEAHAFHIRLSGGPAQGIAQALEKRLATPVECSSYSEVANAIGAAMARPTFDCTLHLDTTRNYYHVEETGEQGKWTGAKRPYHEVLAFLNQLAEMQAEKVGIKLRDPEIEPFDFFPVVRGYETVGQIIRGAMHMRPGVIGRLKR